MGGGWRRLLFHSLPWQFAKRKRPRRALNHPLGLCLLLLSFLSLAATYYIRTVVVGSIEKTTPNVPKRKLSRSAMRQDGRPSSLSLPLYVVYSCLFGERRDSLARENGKRDTRNDKWQDYSSVCEEMVLLRTLTMINTAAYLNNCLVKC